MNAAQPREGKISLVSAAVIIADNPCNGLSLCCLDQRFW